MKRVLAALLCCLCLASCGRAYPPRYEMRQDLGIWFTNADALAGSIRAALVRRDYSITISYSSHRDNMEAIGTIVRELMEAALAETDSPEEGDYLRFQMGGYEMQYSYTRADDRYCYTITILPQYYTTAVQEETVTQRVQEVMDGFGFTRQTSDLDRVRRIYDFVLANTRYDEVHAKNPAHHLKTTAYAALVQGQAVCQGYAVLLYRLLREAGIPTRVITGTAGGVNHAWNLVGIGGVYYNLDATWDDRNGDAACFLTSDAALAGHVRDEDYTGADFAARYPMAAQSLAPKEESHEKTNDH